MRQRGYSPGRLREPACGDVLFFAASRTGMSAPGLGSLVLPGWSDSGSSSHNLATSLDAAPFRSCDSTSKSGHRLCRQARRQRGRPGKASLKEQGDDCKNSALSARGYHRLSLVNSPTARQRPDRGGRYKSIGSLPFIDGAEALLKTPSISRAITAPTDYCASGALEWDRPMAFEK